MLVMACLFSSCSFFKKVQPPAIIKLDVDDFPDFYDELFEDINENQNTANNPYENLKKSAQQSLDYVSDVVSYRKFTFGDDKYTPAEMKVSIEKFLEFIKTSPSKEELNQFIKNNYQVYRSQGDDTGGQGFFTGYYEPELNGSLEKTEKFKYPLYGKPRDLITVNLSEFSKSYGKKRIVGRIKGKNLVPYYPRSKIEEGVIHEQTDVFCWIDNPIDLFFLHIQGSGKVLLTNGNVLNVHYHMQNGHQYKSIGKLLLIEKKIPKEKMSMQSIRAYLQENPGEVKRVLNYNPSYIFFRYEDYGPLGCLGVPLTPGRSIATDRKISPDAAISFIITQRPVVDENNEIIKWKDFGRFVMNQDTGGAIRGPGRADIFWGNGKYAEIAAGHTQHRGFLYFLVLKREK